MHLNFKNLKFVKNNLTIIGLNRWYVSAEEKKTLTIRFQKTMTIKKKLLKYTWIIMGLQDKGQSFLIYTELNFLL